MRVLIKGERGRGKEILGEGMEKGRGGKRKGFIGIKCGGLGEELVEWEVFGDGGGGFSGVRVGMLLGMVLGKRI